MLFEVVTQADPAGLTSDEFSARFRKALTYMKGLSTQGVIEHAWIRVGGNGATTIFRVDSHEELLRHLNGNPLVPYLKYEVVPLVDSAAFQGLEER